MARFCTFSIAIMSFLNSGVQTVVALDNGFVEVAEHVVVHICKSTNLR